MISKRVGRWSWALSGPECLAAAVGNRSTKDDTPVSPKLKLLFEQMCEKQKKLSARGF